MAFYETVKHKPIWSGGEGEGAHCLYIVCDVFFDSKHQNKSESENL